MEQSDFKEIITKLIDTEISVSILNNYKHLKTNLDFFKNIEQKISSSIDIPFSLIFIEIPKDKDFKFIYLSESFYKITGLNKNQSKDFNIFYKYISQNHKNAILNTKKELNEDNKLAYVNFFFYNYKKGKKELLSFNKLFKIEDNNIFLNIILDLGRKNIQAEKKTITNTKRKKLSIGTAIIFKSPLSIIITNIIGQILYINPNFEKLTGYTKKESIGKNPRFLQSGLTPKKTYKNLWHNLSSRKSWEGFFVNRKKDGSLYYENAIIFPFYDKEGNINKYIAIKNDISKEIKLQNKFIKSKKTERSILNLSNIGFCRIKGERIVSINNKFLDFSGYKKEDLISLSIDKLQQTLREIIRMAQINTREKDEFKFEHFFKNTNKHVSIKSYYEKESLFLILTDITKIKKTEESLIYRNYVQNELIEFINVALVSFDEFGHIINMNKDFIKLAKSSLKELVNKQISSFFKEKSVKDLLLKKEIENIKTEFTDTQNNIYDIIISTKHLKDNLREDKLVIHCQIEDITREIHEKEYLEKIVKQKTKELEKSLKKEKELNILKTDFISKTSHEFRTPLATISVASQFIKKFKDKMTKEQLSAKINKILNQAEYMEHLLDDILLVGRFDSQKVPFAPKPTDIFDFLNEMITEFKNLKPEFSFNFVNNAKNTIVDLDDRLGRSIFQNLISNAIKYSSENKNINIELLNSDNELIIEIQDFGIGIPNNYKDKLFTSFVRADNAATVEGTGLGLTIVKKSLEKHKGNIFFTSELNQGTTFWVHLPLKK